MEVIIDVLNNVIFTTGICYFIGGRCKKIMEV